MIADNILFYSPSDDYSRQILSLITSYNIEKQFVHVNINNPEYKLPAFVDRIPMIFIKNENQLVVDENLPQYINTLKPQQERTATNDVSMYDMGRGISDSFSFIDGAGSTPTGNYLFLDKEPETIQQSAMPTTIDTSKQNRLDLADFERFTTQRDMDSASFKQQKR